MTIDTLVRMFLSAYLYYAGLNIDDMMLKRKMLDAKLDYMRKLRDIAAALIMTAQINFDDFSLHQILGDLLQLNKRLSDKAHAAQCEALGKQQSQKLDENFDDVLAIEARTSTSLRRSSHFIEPELDEMCHVLVILPENPHDLYDIEDDEDAMIERINDVVSSMNLTCTNCVSSRSPVCVLVGLARPIDIALFVKRHGGQMMYNFTNKTFDMPSEGNISS